jgi:hypothetical protein
MNELYWITRIGAINTCFITFLVLASFLLIGLMINYIILINVPCPFERELRNLAKTKKWIGKSIIFLSISLLGILFTPTTKEMYLIYGLGGTIDYIKSNDKAKKLPDKCIDALDKYIESLNKEKDK